MVLFPNENNIIYPNTVEVPMKNKKPTESWMQEYTLDERKAKFFEFCDKFDQRKDDLLRDDFQIFSHRLHWDEHPFVERYKDGAGLVNLLSMKQIWYTITFSFSNEHWGTMMALEEDGQEGL